MQSFGGCILAIIHTQLFHDFTNIQPMHVELSDIFTPSIYLMVTVFEDLSSRALWDCLKSVALTLSLDQV